MQLQRWLTAIIALPFLVFFIIKASLGLFAVLIAFVSLIAQWEYLRIVFHKTENRHHLPLSILGLTTGPVMIWAAYLDAGSHIPHLIPVVITANLMVSGVIALFLFKVDPAASEMVRKQLHGVIYIPLLLSFLVFLRADSDGVSWIFLLLCIIFSGDTGAYYTGKYFGDRKLCPWVSPKKTVAGAMGGLAANILVGSIVKMILLPSLPWPGSIFLFVAAGAAGQVGDLFESVLKRTSDIKDSGSILPGHGGILDRIDALLFAAPVAYIFMTYIFKMTG